MESSWSSFRVAIFHTFLRQALIAALVAFPLKISSVALFLKVLIIESQYHGYHAMSICIISIAEDKRRCKDYGGSRGRNRERPSGDV